MHLYGTISQRDKGLNASSALLPELMVLLKERLVLTRSKFRQSFVFNQINTQQNVGLREVGGGAVIGLQQFFIPSHL